MRAELIDGNEAERAGCTLRQALDFAERVNATTTKCVFSGREHGTTTDGDAPFEAIIIVRGVPETAQVLKAIERLERKWETHS